MSFPTCSLPYGNRFLVWYFYVLPAFILARSDATPLAQTCYNPDGTFSGDIPCWSVSTASACCGPGWECLPNNICKNHMGDLSRGSCTDQTWESTGCPQFCYGTRVPTLGYVGAFHILFSKEEVDRATCSDESLSLPSYTRANSCPVFS